MCTPVSPSFTIYKWGLVGSKLYKHVFVLDSHGCKVYPCGQRRRIRLRGCTGSCQTVRFLTLGIWSFTTEGLKLKLEVYLYHIQNFKTGSILTWVKVLKFKNPETQVFKSWKAKFAHTWKLSPMHSYLLPYLYIACICTMSTGFGKISRLLANSNPLV